MDQNTEYFNDVNLSELACRVNKILICIPKGFSLVKIGKLILKCAGKLILTCTDKQSAEISNTF